MNIKFYLHWKFQTVLTKIWQENYTGYDKTWSKYVKAYMCIQFGGFNRIVNIGIRELICVLNDPLYAHLIRLGPNHRTRSRSEDNNCPWNVRKWSKEMRMWERERGFYLPCRLPTRMTTLFPKQKVLCYRSPLSEPCIIYQIHKSHDAPVPYPQCTSQTRNLHNYVLNGALWGMDNFL